MQTIRFGEGMKATSLMLLRMCFPRIIVKAIPGIKNVKDLMPSSRSGIGKVAMSLASAGVGRMTLRAASFGNGVSPNRYRRSESSYGPSSIRGPFLLRQSVAPARHKMLAAKNASCSGSTPGTPRLSYSLVPRPSDLFLNASGRACPAPTPRPCRGEARLALVPHAPSRQGKISSGHGTSNRRDY